MLISLWSTNQYISWLQWRPLIINKKNQCGIAVEVNIVHSLNRWWQLRIRIYTLNALQGDVHPHLLVSSGIGRQMVWSCRAKKELQSGVLKATRDRNGKEALKLIMLEKCTSVLSLRQVEVFHPISAFLQISKQYRELLRCLPYIVIDPLSYLMICFSAILIVYSTGHVNQFQLPRSRKL